MTIGTILPEILAECGIDRSAPDIAENSFEMRQILALMNAAGRDINRRVEWAKAQASFQVVSASSATLPADFQEMADAGAVVWGSAGHYPVRPCTSPELWQLFEKFPPAQLFYMLKDGKIYFSSAIGAEGATVWYVSKNWVTNSDTITSNAGVTVFPESLLARGTIWRWKRQKGLPYDDLLTEFEAQLETQAKADRGMA